MTPPRIIQIAVGPMANFAYLIGDDGSGVSAAVDPGWEAARIAAEAKRAEWIIEKILLTHTHFDHANGLEELVDLTGATTYVHAAEKDQIPKGIAKHATGDGDTIEVGGLSVRCMHTPGHTPGSQCFAVMGAIITGDTLFIDGCGRVDLPGSDPKKMLAALRKLAALEPSTVVYPGHDYGSAKTSTIGEQLKQNPYLSAESESMLL